MAAPIIHVLSGALAFNEKASAPTTAAGKGYLWVKSDTPSSLQFTDDAGTTSAVGLGSSVSDINIITVANINSTYILKSNLRSQTLFVVGQYDIKWIDGSLYQQGDKITLIWYESPGLIYHNQTYTSGTTNYPIYLAAGSNYDPTNTAGYFMMIHLVFTGSYWFEITKYNISKAVSSTFSGVASYNPRTVMNAETTASPSGGNFIESFVIGSGWKYMVCKCWGAGGKSNIGATYSGGNGAYTMSIVDISGYVGYYITLFRGYAQANTFGQCYNPFHGGTSGGGGGSVVTIGSASTWASPTVHRIVCAAGGGGCGGDSTAGGSGATGSAGAGGGAGSSGGADGTNAATGTLSNVGNTSCSTPIVLTGDTGSGADYYGGGGGYGAGGANGNDYGAGGSFGDLVTTLTTYNSSGDTDLATYRASSIAATGSPNTTNINHGLIVVYIYE